MQCSSVVFAVFAWSNYKMMSAEQLAQPSVLLLLSSDRDYFMRSLKYAFSHIGTVSTQKRSSEGDGNKSICCTKQDWQLTPLGCDLAKLKETLL